MRKIRLVVEYDGTEFHGWQVQPQVRTVQGDLETALKSMTSEASGIQGASRTDARVHACGQVAHFTTSSSITPEQFAKGMTSRTGYDVAIVAADEVSEDYSARFDAKGKTYRYLVWNRPPPSPLRRHRSWHVRKELDVEAMVSASKHLVGRHDFAAFRASTCDQPTTVREIRLLEISRDREGLIEVTVVGTAFLQHMVRIMVGTLVEVGRGKLTPDDIERIRLSLDRTQAGRTAPPQGLCLVQVHY